jgi:hypothetical protein
MSEVVREVGFRSQPETAEGNAEVGTIHPKAMPAILTTGDE